jgi:antitoxin VapB
MSEFDEKQERIHGLLAAHGLEALLLRRVSSFAWATCGAASYVNSATTEGSAALVVSRSGRHLITSNVEATRLDQEEGLRAQGWEFHVAPWHETRDAVAELTRGLRLGTDLPCPEGLDLSGEMTRLRASLTPEEGERFASLGGLCAQAMDSAIRQVRPGQTEHEIAACLAREAEWRGAQAIVNLIATDERVFKFRHPLPAERKLERYAMLVLCGRKGGLVCSITRLVHFGSLPDDLRRKAEAVAQVDAALIEATRPGRSLGEIFRMAVAAYARVGFADEWKLHHQGGPAGYEPREMLARPDSTELVAAGQAFAWNPSITGTKSEDTILVGESGNTVLTQISGWPLLEIPAEAGRKLARPAVLEIL